LGRIGQALFGGREADSPPAVVDTPAQAAQRIDLRLKAAAFSSARVADVMVPRADITALEVATPFGDVLQAFASAQHSRLPLFVQTLDEPVGLIHLKDLITEIATRQRDGAMIDPGERLLDRLKREVLYAPASMRLPDLLLKMQSTRIHMALIIDEYGGTDGLVSLEDLMEQIVGDIEDEHDSGTDGITEVSKDVWEVEARAYVSDFTARTGQSLMVEDLADEVDTVGGVIATLAGRVPQTGEVLTHPNGFQVHVLDATPRRIKRLRLTAIAWHHETGEGGASRSL
jgi:CBS domain containing-hemolysin-like protein